MIYDVKVKSKLTQEEIDALIAKDYKEINEETYQLILGNIDGQQYILNYQDYLLTGNISFKPLIVVKMSLEDLKTSKLFEISNWTKDAIVSGFYSNASGENALFDSDETDQQNIQIMLAASKSPDFETSEYQGVIPIRGIPNGEVAKKIYYLNAAAMQQLSDDLARHIGSCKLRGWALQEATAVAQSKEELDAIVWENS